MEDLESEDRFVDGASYWEGESLVPDRASRARIIDASGMSLVRVVEIECGVRLQIAVSPIDVFEVFCGDYRNL